MYPGKLSKKLWQIGNMVKDLNKFNDWVKVWSGRWSLHFDSHIGDDWTRNLKVSGKPVFLHAIYFYSKGITDCWVRQKEKDFLGQRLCAKTRKDKKFVSKLCKSFIALADEVTAFLNRHNPKKLTNDNVIKFWELISRYYLPHLSVKYMVDYLSPVELKKYLPQLERARLYAEQIFRNSEDFLEKYFVHISSKEGYPKNILLASTANEFKRYLISGNLPSKKILRDRFNKSALIVKQSKQELFVGKRVSIVNNIVSSHVFKGSLSGQSAFRGMVRGTVKIIHNPTAESAKFKKGNVLITGMTRPEFLPLMKKASAFVTDAGGILSHAAITARELKKPCIIGTKIASKVFNDGDRVEVDAHKGIVRKL